MQCLIVRRLISVSIAGLVFLGGNPELLALQNQDQLRIVVIENGSKTVEVKGGQEASVVVQVQDMNGRVSGAQVVFKVPDTGAGGTFANGSTSITIPTDAMGTAEAKTFRRNTIGGTFQMTVSASKGTASGMATIFLTNLASSHSSHKKLYIVVGVAAGAVVAAVLAAGHGGSGGGSSTSTPSITPGTPTVTGGQ